MWFKHRAWIPIAWLLSLGNVIATWFAAQPAEPWHATIHALLAVLFGVGAQRLSDRQRLKALGASDAELPTELTAMRAELAALRQAQYEILKRVERSVDGIAIEVERVGEGQRFLTKALMEARLTSDVRSPEADPHLLRRESPNDNR